jgi:hypothetical protein
VFVRHERQQTAATSPQLSIAVEAGGCEAYPIHGLTMQGGVQGV